MASDISCCSNFIECSNAGRCIKLHDPMYEELYKDCAYSKQLEKGLNFYTKFNENNRRRALEYAEKMRAMKSKQFGRSLVRDNQEPKKEPVGQISLFDMV